MRLFIAEKPELARAIVDGLGGGQRRDGYYECGSDTVTWCFGHMLQLLDPEDYDGRYSQWTMEDLPIILIPWRKKPGTDKKDQLDIISQLLDEADCVIHAGDPDDEGQLLIDEILSYTGCQLPVQRLLINDTNTKVVRRALHSMRNNAEFKGLSDSAEARSVGDQLYGYNMTRAYTLAARAKGFQGLLSVGRVQTPILGLVVRRDREHAAHEKTYYYNIFADVEFGVSFPCRYLVTNADPVDEKGRLIDPEWAAKVVDAVKQKPAKIVSADTNRKYQSPPLPYNLLKLQSDASRKFGFKPNETKDITQSLREKHKLITYNRSDCEYLSEEQHSDAPGVLDAIAKTASVLASAAQRSDHTVKSRAFDSSKVSAHHAIIPTEKTASFSDLSDSEQKLYLLIARAYIAQFWPKHTFDQTDVLVLINEHQFSARSLVTISPGWLSLYKNDVGNDDLPRSEETIATDLRMLSKGDQGLCLDSRSEKKETRPRPLYTMATLLSDLTRVAKYVRDDKLRQVLIEKDKAKEGEHGGIGTPATRDTIIATLFDRGYLIEKGKHIVSTDTGKEFYDCLPDQAKYPDMTALWHEQQKAIQAGDLDISAFVNELMEYISKEIDTIKQHGLDIHVQTFPCPSCQKPLRRIKKKQGNTYFWGCTGYEDGCKYACDDYDGKPSLKPLLNVSKLHKCMDCGKGLIRRHGKKKGKQRSYFWGCSGYPDCKRTYPDVRGKPNFQRRKA